MWLLDENISRKIKPILKSAGIDSFTVQEKNWRGTRNGDLVAKATAEGFDCILTQDVKFIESASKSLLKSPELAIVLVTLKQKKGSSYVTTFEKEFLKSAITPVPGKLVKWPE